MSVFGLPEWVPWWAQLLLLIVAILIFLALVSMPFSVFGLKSRLDGIEARLDDMQADLRALAARLPEPGRQMVEEAPRPTIGEERPAPSRPPVPPPAWTPDGAPRRPIGAGVQPARQEPGLGRPRLEPRIDKFR